MPSLKQLEAFRKSFFTLGNEPAVLAEQHMIPEDFSLPGAEPPAPPPPRREAPGGNGPVKPEDPEPAPAALGDDLDFSAFLDTIPDDPAPPSKDAEPLAGPDKAEVLEDLAQAGEPSPLSPEGGEDAGGTGADPLELMDHNQMISLFSEPSGARGPAGKPFSFDDSISANILHDNGDGPDTGLPADEDQAAPAEELAGEDPGPPDAEDSHVPSDLAMPSNEDFELADRPGTPEAASIPRDADAAFSGDNASPDFDGLAPPDGGGGDFTLSDADFDVPEDPASAMDGLSPPDAGNDGFDLPDDDFGIPGEPVVPAIDGPSAPAADGDDFTLSDADFDVPEDPSGAMDGPRAPDAGDDGFDLPDDDFGIPGEPGVPAIDGLSAPAADGDDFTLSDADFDVPEDSASVMDGPRASDAGNDGFDLPDDDFGIPGETPASEGDVFPPDNDLGGLASPGAGGEGEMPLDTFESFDLDAGKGEGSAGTGKEKPRESAGSAGGAAQDFGDFSLDGIDGFLEKTPAAGAAGVSAPAGRTRAAASKDAEAINLTNEEFAKLQNTLSSYPLNLRIACEELIVEQAVAPELMSALIKNLVKGAPPKETAALAGKILGRGIPIPRGFEKKTGEELEAEQSRLPYIFVHQFLPALRIFLFGAAVAASLFYLTYQFVYQPLFAESLYKRGYALIPAGDYGRANERFQEAFNIHRTKKWFYRYAEAFADQPQYILAEEKYDQLLAAYPRDKKGALDYAALETDHIKNYAKADRIIRNNILDYAVDDREGLTALGDINMAWGEVAPERYENARVAYARLLARYGWKDPVVERMLRYFIRTDNLGEVLSLQQYFNKKGRVITPASLAELGGYLLDKRLEDPKGVPDAHVERIEGIRDILLKAVNAAEAEAVKASKRAKRQIPPPPEPYYHLSRYYNHYGNSREETAALERAIQVFDETSLETPRRTAYRLDTERRYARLLTNNREFTTAGEHLVKAIGIYEDALNRDSLTPSPEYGRLYADLGDLEYFTRNGDMEAALDYYRRSEQNGWAPPEMRYRMGFAHYHLGAWDQALERFFAASTELSNNRRLLYAMGNAAYLQGDYFVAQGYYRKLLEILNLDRARFSELTPNDRTDHQELAERIMAARNNMGVTLDALTNRTGDMGYRSEALGMYAESMRAWDTLTRNPKTMIRSGAGELSAPGISHAYLNSQNTLYPKTGYDPLIYMRIDKDVLEPSAWEELVEGPLGLSGLLD
ncbi:MAG: tetratricopeptide repeat protein [Treponema sp.]|jgi:tetratricopeptide (TPR) repeat protein|nr:tetratricopeptide repeat protein [Treponema sp.]